jgi:outer membrane beta-barrel protein
MKNHLILIVATATIINFCFGSQSFAQSKPRTTPAEDSAADSDKMDLKKLEEKYWSAKDADFKVVQNRTYTKAKKPFISFGYGPLVNDAYSYGRMFNVAGGYYLSEYSGFELSYETGNLKDSDSTDYFINRNGFAPNYNKFKKYIGASYIYVPFYAKMSFMGKKILYFDIQFGVGLGQISYQSQISEAQGGNQNYSATAISLDVTQQLFFAEHFAIRLDVKNKWSRQNQNRYQISTGPPLNETEDARSLGTINQQDTSVLLGITYFH